MKKSAFETDPDPFLKNRPDIQAVFLDIDGTLFSHTTRTVPASTRQALALLKEKGIARLIITGRSPFEMEGLGLEDLDMDGIILLNGVLGMDREGQIWLDHPIKPQQQKILVDCFDAKQFPLALIEKDRIYINYLNADVLQAQEDLHIPPPPVDFWRHGDLYMGVAYECEGLQKAMPLLKKHFQVTYWSDFGVDIVPESAGKAAAIAEYASLHQLKSDQIMTFGDGQNDMEMLAGLGIGVAMGNAPAQVQACADYVTDSVDANGIWNALAHFGLLDSSS